MPAVKAESQLGRTLRSLRQGDLLTTGAVSIVGLGPSQVADAADAEVVEEELWSVTVESEPGWYAVISQDCDIVRNPRDEPCIVVCPVLWVPQGRWAALRNGPYSPRHFPLPQHRALVPDADQWPVASLQYLTSVDKMALLTPSVQQLALLTGPQRRRFAYWVGRRFLRPAHDDLVEQNVLSPCGTRIKELAKKFDKAGGQVTDAMRVVGAAEEWFVEATDKYVQLHAAVTEASLNAAGLWDHQRNSPKDEQIGQGVTQLRKDLSKRLPAGGGYVVRANVANLASVSVEEFRSAWAPWVLEGHDPLEP